MTPHSLYPQSGPCRLDLIRSRYDDGGYSGGSTERPALQRLLTDVRPARWTSLWSTRSTA
jgi:DNA invertase Pin-like site-specific DNA recombinase